VTEFRLPIGDWADHAVDWVITHWSAFFTFLRDLFSGMYDAVDWVFTTPPPLVIIVIAVILALLARGWAFGIGTAAGLGIILGVNQWTNAMNTLSLVIVAAVIAIAIAIPLGVAAAKSDAVSSIVKPVLDFLQTMPSFVYLIPALLLFRLGVAPGIVATIIFSIAPGVRLTELGIRGVDRETVEAGASFGATPWRILRQIQLPLALPSIMAGINQVIMLSLSMVVIAGLVGAGGLGEQVIAAMNRLDVALGAEAGIAVVILAMLLDRFTGAFGLRKGLLAKIMAPKPRE
jgi:ABC-type proline/glycine betaine transport system permease subunit